MALEALRVAGAPLIQANFNMMDVRALTSGLLDEVASMEAGFIARTPLCFGFLSGTIGRTAVFPPGDHRLGWSRAQLDNWIDGAADLLQAVGAAPGEEGALAALRFCLSFPAVTTTIPGILRPGEAESNARAGALGPLPAPSVEAVLEINRRREFFVAPARAS
jgi:aryl-alcohol dehydrogenase-like predicted oxidoreductase